MTLLLVALALACAGGATWIVATDIVIGRQQRAAAARLAAYGAAAHAVTAPSARERGLNLAAPLARITLRLAPGRDRERTAAQLQAAGFKGTSVETFLAVKSGLALGLAFLGILLGLGIGGAGALLFAIAGAGIGFVAPDLMLSRRARSRKERILRELPNALDLLAVVVEAGLGLDAALARYADRADGPLADEIGLLVAELRVGSSRAAVFKAFAERVPSLETQSFVRAIVTADQLGVSLSRTLRVQAQDARVRRQMVAEQQANKTPVKILFPTVLCIFPSLFIVILAPAVLKLLNL